MSHDHEQRAYESNTFAREALLVVLAALSLIFASVVRHPGALTGKGKNLLITDVALLLLYAAAAAWAWRQRSPKINVTLRVAAPIGVALGAVMILNHLTECFVANRSFLVVITPVLCMFALLAAAGSIAYERTRSLALAAMSGLWCAVFASPALILFAFSFDLAFESRALFPLRGAIVAVSLTDPGAFITANSLQAASEVLVRILVVALCLAVAGAFIRGRLKGRSRVITRALALLMPILLLGAIGSLWHADTLPRPARPPFVMLGVLMAGVAISIAHPAWSELRRKLN